MMKFVSAIDDKDKQKVTEEEILENFIQSNPNYIDEHELKII